ncbi:MAG: AgmX/PglI C-terminal domain-containing protein [Myxococcales bacterium]
MPPEDQPAPPGEAGSYGERRWQKDGQRAGVQIIHVAAPHYPSQVAERIIRASLPAFRRCYGGGLERDERLAGTVGLRLRLGSDGQVADATRIPDQTSLPDPQVVECLIAQQRTTVLPAPEPGSDIIEYQLLLKLEPVPPWQSDIR